MTVLKWLLLLLPVLIYLFYRWSISTYDYFVKRGIPYVKPYPLVGGLWPVYAGKLHPSDAAVLGYNMFPRHRFSGFFVHRKAGYLIHDPELVKQITIKNFDHFTDHMTVIPIEVDPIFGRSLFFMGGERWRHGRPGLSAAFTGSKMRNMFTLLSTYTEAAMKRLLDDAHGGMLEKEMRDLFQKFGNDIIASISFGVEIDSVHEPNNDFFLRGKQLIATGNFQGLKLSLLTLLPPSWFKFLRMTLLPKDAADFYTDAVAKSIRRRQQTKIVRPDFIHLLLQARNNTLDDNQTEDSLKSAGFTTVEEHIQSSTKNSEYNDLDIAAVTASFFFGGIESTSTLLCFAVYELSLNRRVQEKLQAEIDGIQKMLTYDALNQMKYLDMVVTETLRRWPPIGVTNRTCTKPYTVVDFNGTEVTIEKGQLVQIPIQSFHMDPKYFPDPYRFDPDRFSDANRSKIVQDAFIPFGSGPRNCIASRLALMQTKCLLYYLLKSFDVEFSNRMEVPVMLDTRSASFNAINGFWFHLIPRNCN